jgi:glutamyl-tRNA reductase
MDSITNTPGKHVVVLGTNHTSSKTELRDRLIVTNTNLKTALRKLARNWDIFESFILSTCNRVEVYAVMENPASAREQLLNFFSDFHGIPVKEFESQLYFYHCEEAVEHFFSVVAGLDSMVIGETQILGQVKEAYYSARDRGNTGTILNKLFHFAMETGKRVRTETRISDGILSVPSAAVDLAKKNLGDLSMRSALIIGAGDMGELTARHLATAGIKKIYFANRTPEHSLPLAEKFGGTALLLDDVDSIMPECDIVITSTGAPHFILTADRIKKVMGLRKHRAIFLIDIAAPRDIEPSAGDLQNVFLYGFDELSVLVSKNSRMRASEIGNAREIIKENLENYFAWYRSLKALPTLISLRKQFELLRDEELKRYAAQIGTLPEGSREIIRQFAVSLTKRFLSNPSKVLKEIAADNDGVMYTRSLTAIFGLKEFGDE